MKNIPEFKFTERKKIMTCYVVFFGSVTLSFLTPPATAVLSFMACVLILAGIYSIRAQTPETSLMHNHMTFLIRTFWRANLYLVYSVFVGLLFLLVMTDYSPFTPCVSYIVDHYSVIMYWGPKEYIPFFGQCAKPFMRENTVNLVVGIFLMMFPILIYLLNRFILGWSHATRGIPVIATKL